MKLSLSEEILLLCLDEQTGRVRPMPDRALDYALAGAILADLAIGGQVRLSESEVSWKLNAPPATQPVHAAAIDLLQKVEVPSLQKLAGRAGQ